MRSLRRFSRPRPRVARRSRYSSRCSALTARDRPREPPRRCARAMFSSMVRSSQVPAMGSWNTRATRWARSQTGRRVMSSPEMWMLPLSTLWSPEMVFRKVDLPAPLEPMTVTNWPSGISSDRPRRARVSMGVPGLKVSSRFLALNIGVRLSSQWAHQYLRLSLRLSWGITRAMVTSTAVTRFRSCALRPMKSLLSAAAMKKR